MKVPLRELPGIRSLHLGAKHIDALTAGLPMRSALGDEAGEAGAADAKLEFYLEGDNVFARGELTAWIELACSRCLVSLHHKIAEPLALTFLPGGMLPLEGDTEDDKADLDESNAETDDTYGYEGEELDMGPVLDERLLLAIPYAPLCKPDCLGLCSQCGANLNDSECGCDRKVIDPRLAALKNIKV
jgi:uncharacterized protein